MMQRRVQRSINISSLTHVSFECCIKCNSQWKCENQSIWVVNILPKRAFLVAKCASIFKYECSAKCLELRSRNPKRWCIPRANEQERCAAAASISGSRRICHSNRWGYSFSIHLSYQSDVRAILYYYSSHAKEEEAFDSKCFVHFKGGTKIWVCRICSICSNSNNCRNCSICSIFRNCSSWGNCSNCI